MSHSFLPPNSSHRGPVMGKPALRSPQPCGSFAMVSGREPTQMGWYTWIAERHPGKQFLDVGAGMGEGMKVLSQSGFTRGYDVDDQLRAIPGILTGTSPLATFGAAAADIVTCLDVIEHVVEDLVLFEELLRLAREVVYITTPNFSRSGALNLHHCREYMLAEFVNIFKPDELWVSSPDGWSLKLQLLVQGTSGWPTTTTPPPGHLPSPPVAYFCPVTGESWRIGDLPLTHLYNQGSPDGQEWAHYCGVFYKSPR